MATFALLEKSLQALTIAFKFAFYSEKQFFIPWYELLNLDAV